MPSSSQNSIAFDSAVGFVRKVSTAFLVLVAAGFVLIFTVAAAFIAATAKVIFGGGKRSS